MSVKVRGGGRVWTQATEYRVGRRDRLLVEGTRVDEFGNQLHTSQDAITVAARPVDPAAAGADQEKWFWLLLPNQK